MKRFLTVCLLLVATLVQSGCLQIAAEGRLQSVYTNGSFVDSVIVDGDGNTQYCTESTSLVPELDCAFGGLGDHSSLGLAGLETFILLFLDPLVIEVPFGASNFSGTYDNGMGVSGNLRISPPMLALPVDLSTTMQAESGMEIVIVDFPSPATVPPGHYHYTLKFTMPSSSPNLRIKPLLAGSVTIGNKTYYPPLLPCATSFADVPAVSILATQDARDLLPADYLSAVKPCNHKVYDFNGAPGPTVTVVEFYNAALDHYFISTNPKEIGDLDTGVHPGWARTGLSFNAYAAANGNASPVCRYYIPPQHGDSHFFSADPSECAAVLQRTTTDPNYSGYVAEAPNVFYIGLPDTMTGACPAGTVPVHRLWNGRADSNHRYTTDPAVVTQMLTKGYVPEGYGPNAVIMCAVA